VAWDAAAYDESVVVALAPEIQQRISALAEAPGWVEWLFVDTVDDYEPKAWEKVMVKGRDAAEVLDEVSARLADDSFDDPERIEVIVMGVGTELSEREGVRVMSQAPVRVALTGSNVGLPLWEPMRILGRERTLARLDAARARLQE
jgi:glutamyl-tRNA synthetase